MKEKSDSNVASSSESDAESATIRAAKWERAAAFVAPVAFVGLWVMLAHVATSRALLACALMTPVLVLGAASVLTFEATATKHCLLIRDRLVRKRVIPLEALKEIAFDPVGRLDLSFRDSSFVRFPSTFTGKREFVQLILQSRPDLRSDQ